MKFTIDINQRAAVDLKLDEILDIVDLSIFSAFKDFANTPECEKFMVGKVVYFWIDYNLIINELPLCKIKTKDGVYRRMKNLAAAKIIQFHPDNQKLGRTFFCWGENYTPMVRQKGTDEKPEGVRIKNRRGYGLKTGGGTDEKPNNNTTNNNYTNNPNLPANAAEPEKENPIIPLKEKKEKGNTPAPGAARPKKEAPLSHWQETITCFEDVHRQHFTSAGIWIGFDWSGKELKGLKELRGKMAKDIEAKNGYKPDANQINAALSRFFSEALKDDFTKNNWFTPAMLNNRYQEIKQKIYAHANGTASAKQRSKTVQEQQHDLLATVIANRRY